MATISVQIYKINNHGEKVYTECATIQVSNKIAKMIVKESNEAYRSIFDATHTRKGTITDIKIFNDDCDIIGGCISL